jgi:hypothetical protein
MLRAILVGGFVAGVLDILYAIAAWGVRGVSPARVLQGVASGLIGREAAVAGGVSTALLGLVAHFVIMLGAAAVFCLASLRFPFLVRRWLFSAVVFGLLMYVAMNYVIVPLSAASGKPPSGINILVALLPHIVVVGPPIAWAARRAALVSGRLAPIFASR